MEDFSDIIGKQRGALSRRRNELMGEKKDLDRQLQEIDLEFGAIEAYERTRKGGAAAPAERPGKRRTGVRQEALGAIQRNPEGLSRADLLERIGAKGNKRAEQSISNALPNLKKQGQVSLEKGVYTPA